MIAIARIIGETAPLLVTTGRDRLDQHQPLPRPHAEPRGLRLQRVQDPGRLQQASYDRAWAAALTLILIVMVLNLVARLIYRRYETEIR